MNYVIQCSEPEDLVHFLVRGSYFVQCTFSFSKTYFEACYNVCRKCLHAAQDIVWNTCATTWPKFWLVFYASSNITEIWHVQTTSVLVPGYCGRCIPLFTMSVLVCS